MVLFLEYSSCIKREIFGVKYIIISYYKWKGLKICHRNIHVLWETDMTQNMIAIRHFEDNEIYKFPTKGNNERWTSAE